MLRMWFSVGPFQLNVFKPGKQSDDASQKLSRHFTLPESNITLLSRDFFFLQVTYLKHDPSIN